VGNFPGQAEAIAPILPLILVGVDVDEARRKDKSCAVDDPRRRTLTRTCFPTHPRDGTAGNSHGKKRIGAGFRIEYPRPADE
jgi:hypothetical protein